MMTSSAPNESKPIRRHVWPWVVVLLLLVWGGMLIVSRTEGFESIVLRKIKKQTGLDLQAERVAVTWDGYLLMKGLTSEAASTDGKPVCTVQEVRSGWSPLHALTGQYAYRIVMVGAELHVPVWYMAENQDDPWLIWLREGCRSVGLFSSVIPVSADAGHRLKVMHTRRRIEIIDGAMVWNGRDGKQMAAAFGVDMVWMPMNTPSRPLMYCEFESARYRESGQPFEPKRLEAVMDKTKTIWLAR